MVTLKVRRFGNAIGVVLPEDFVSRLITRDGAALHLMETPDGGYRLVPGDPDFETKMEKAEEIIRRYPETLKILAQ